MEIIKEAEFINFEDLKCGDVFTSIYNRDDYFIKVKDIVFVEGENHDFPRVNSTNLEFNNFYCFRDKEQVVRHKAILKIEP